MSASRVSAEPEKHGVKNRITFKSESDLDFSITRASDERHFPIGKRLKTLSLSNRKVTFI